MALNRSVSRSESGLTSGALRMASPIIIDTFSGDDLLNAREKRVDQLISGRVSDDIAVGESVTVEAFGQRWQTTVGNDRVWSLTLPSGEVSSFPDGQALISAMVNDADGVQRFAVKAVTLQAGRGNDYSARIEIHPVADDAILHAIAAGDDLSFSGRTYNVASGKTVTVTLNGQDYAALVQPGGVWRVTVPDEDLQALHNGKASLQAAVIDLTETAATSQQLLVAHSVTETGRLMLDAVTGDDVVDAGEAQAPLRIGGSSLGITAGNRVEVVVNDIYHYGLIQEDGSWQIMLTFDEVARLPEGENYLYVNSYDEFHRYSADTAVFIMDRIPPYQPISLDNVSGDSSVYGREKRVDQVISGMLDESNADWRQLTVQLNGKSYHATLTSEGAWSAVIPSADMLALPVGNVLLRAQALNENGDIYTSNKIINVAAGRGNSYSAQVTLNPLAEASVFNALENGQDLLVSGRAYNAASGKTVTVTLNGERYTSEVQDGGYWHLAVPHSALHALRSGTATLLASLADLGETATSVQIINVDKPQPQIHLDPFTGDNVLSFAESQSDQRLSGTVQHIQSGQTITVTLGEEDYSAVTTTGGHWTTLIPAADLQALIENSAVIEARVTTEWGIEVSTAELLLIQDPPRADIIISPISGDQILTPEEALSPLTIAGTLEGSFAPGSRLEMVIGEGIYYTFPAGATWSFTLSPAQLAQLEEGSNTVYVRTHDAFGREVTAVQSLLVDKADQEAALAPDALGIQASQQEMAQLLIGEEAAPLQENVMLKETPVLLAGAADSEIWAPAAQSRMVEATHLPVTENTVAEMFVQHHLDTRII